MEKPVHLLVQIQEIQCDSKIGKSRHFIAADRKEKYSKRLGIAVILIGVFIGSTFIKFMGDKEVQNILLASLGFLSASLAAIQTFFNFSKDVENHRKIGNFYLDIARDCDNLLSKYKDHFLGKDECQEKFDGILARYKTANKEEEVCPNSDRDFKKAYQKNKENKERLRSLKNETIYKEV